MSLQSDIDYMVSERLRPNADTDYTASEAVRLLRRYGQSIVAEQMNEWIVANNALKSEAATALTASRAEVERLTRELNEAREYAKEARLREKDAENRRIHEQLRATTLEEEVARLHRENFQ